jgi:hypothetical protein
VDNPLLLNILRRSLNPEIIVSALQMTGAVANTLESLPPMALRTQLANAGWPDGLSLILAYTGTPGVINVAEQLQKAGIQAQLLALAEAEVGSAFEEGRIQAALITWTILEERQDWINRFGNDNVIDLYTIPISYIATEGLKLEFTLGGWPIPAQ